MAQLQVPISIWLSSTPDERDGFYLAAGFDPSLPVVDNGTDTTTVRFRQDSPVAALSVSDPVSVAPVAIAGGMQAGDDLRDFQQVSTLTGDNPVTDEFGIAAPASFGVALAMAGRALRIIMGGGGGRLAAATWNALPALVRSALTQAGIGIGAFIAFNGDIPFITLPGQGGPGDPLLPMPQNGVDIQVGGHAMHAAAVVGSWNTNPKDPSMGVTFYRLANGWLAVQKKNGSWKTWKPKKPIVLYADGAKDLKTLVKAERAVTKQAKALAKIINRRAAPKKRSTAATHSPIILGRNAHIVEH